MGFLNAVSAARQSIALLILIGIVVWLVWLFSMARSKLDYVVQDASSRPVLPVCEWVSVSAPAVATLGSAFIRYSM